MRVVFYGSDSCQPCKQMWPLAKRVVEEHDLELVYRDVGEDAGRLNIRGVPTIVFYDRDRPVGRLTGQYAEPMFRRFVREILGPLSSL